MTRVPGIDPDGAESLYRSALALVPDLLIAHRAHMGALWNAGSIDAETKERIRLRAVETAGCVYCSATRHVLDGKLLWQFDGPERAAEVPTDPRLALALEYADAFCSDSGPMDERLRERMAEYFKDEEIIELSACLATFGSFPKTVISLDLHGEIDGTYSVAVPGSGGA